MEFAPPPLSNWSRKSSLPRFSRLPIRFKSCPELSQKIRPPSAFPSAKRFSSLSCSYPYHLPFNAREAVFMFFNAFLPTLPSIQAREAASYPFM